jgi:hypothetical protein
MVDDGYLIGFEDSSGNFVEVGRFNNLADDVTQPLEIKHANSGERITLDSSGLKTQKIDDDRLYAGAFPGANADARFDNAISSAAAGDVIFLENAVYTKSRTFSTKLSLIGTAVRFSGTDIQGSPTWTFNEAVNISDISNSSGDLTLDVNAGPSAIESFIGTGSTQININTNGCTIDSINNCTITLSSGTVANIIDSCSNTAVADNGNNTIGDI